MRLIAVLLSAALAACAATQEPASYLLEAAPRAQPAGPLDGPALGLREVELPLYARRPQMATIGPGGEVSSSDLHRWAEEPPRAASRLIARALSASLARPVVVEPWPPGVAPAALVDVDVDYLIGALGGELRLGGQYRLTGVDGSGGAARPFDMREPVAGETYGALAAAHGRALDALADLVAADLVAAGL